MIISPNFLSFYSKRFTTRPTLFTLSLSSVPTRQHVITSQLEFIAGISLSGVLLVAVGLIIVRIDRHVFFIGEWEAVSS